MRRSVREFVSMVSRTLPTTSPIYEFGAFQVPGQESLANLRPFFPGKKYIGTDMRHGPGVDIVLNLHKIDLPSESAGSILCLDTLEHVEHPHLAMQEIYRVLQPGGIAVISSVMLWHIHDHPNDYWRFTPDAFRSILKPFENSFVGYAGEEVFPHTVVGIGFKGDFPGEFNGFLTEFEEWQKKAYMNWKFEQPPQLRNLFEKLSPTSQLEVAVVELAPAQSEPLPQTNLSFKRKIIELIRLICPPIVFRWGSRIFWFFYRRIKE